MKTLKPEDFKLTPEQVKNLVVGAQTFLAPAPDPSDEEVIDKDRRGLGPVYIGHGPPPTIS